jgi:2-desacetyl-2-hydroxyethyl bacteriochlorophyllide A dehydrogenase
VFVIHRVDEVRLAETTLPAPANGEVLVDTVYSCVSPGTELRCLAGLQDGLGRDHFPFIPGYALVGRVVTSTPSARLAAGQWVFCSGTKRATHRLAWGGHVGRALVPASQVVPLPVEVDPLEASLLKLAAIAYRGVRVARPAPGKKVAVVGLGPIGQLAARLFAGIGAEVVAADVSPARVATAAASGLTALHVTESANLTVRERWPHGADIVVDATGSAVVLRQSVELVRDRPWTDVATGGGKLVVQGSYSGSVPFPQDIAFSKELEMHWPRDCQREDYEAVLTQLAEGSLRIKDLVGEAVPVREAPQVYAALRQPGQPRLTAAFDWRSADHAGA